MSVLYICLSSHFHPAENRLNNAVVGVGYHFNASSNDFNRTLFSICGYGPPSFPRGATININCTSPSFGTYVAIWIKGTGSHMVTLCDVEVYGKGNCIEIVPLFCCTVLLCNPQNAQATFSQSTRTQRFFYLFETHLNPVMLIFIG